MLSQSKSPSKVKRTSLQPSNKPKNRNPKKYLQVSNRLNLSLENRLDAKYFINNKMGAKSSAQMMHYYIENAQLTNIEQLVQKEPSVLFAHLTSTSKMTPLYKACFIGDLQVVRCLVQKCKADVNQQTQMGQTPLIAATKRYHKEVVRYLLGKGAKVNLISGSGLSVLQYAILPGYYQIGLMLYQKLDSYSFKTPEQYQQLHVAHDYRRYVNYQMFVEALKIKKHPDNVGAYLQKAKKIWKDPVADPRETWKAWIWRRIEFKDPPLVQRDELPDQFQPQNRRFGKINVFFSNLTRSPLSPQSYYYPRDLTATEGPCTQSEMNKIDILSSDQPHNKTVS